MAILLVAAGGVVAFVSPPLDGARTPEIKSVSLVKAGGCGLYKINSSSKTSTYVRPGQKSLYTRVALTTSELKVLDQELVRKGFKRFATGTGVTYRQSSGGIFPLRSSVMLLQDGRVFGSVSRRWWPSF